MAAEIAVGSQGINAFAMSDELGGRRLVDCSLTPHTPLSREIDKAGNLLVTNAARGADIHIPVEPSDECDNPRLP